MNRSTNFSPKRRMGLASTGSGGFEIAPASLCSLAIALWGWHTGLIFVAVPIVLILEARHVVQQRWEISLSDFKEAAKLCVALVAILAVVLITVKKSVFIYSLLQWLPVAGVPLLIAQTYGLGVQALLNQQFSSSYQFYQGTTRSKVSSQISGQVARRASINLYTVYFGVCIVAASAADSDHFFFYAGAAALTALFLWPLRPQRTSPILWCLLFCLSVGIGFAGHRQLTYAQRQLEARVYAMIGDIASGGAVDPDGTATQMGSVGRLKLSNKIAFRVKADSAIAEDSHNAASASPFPLLLQEATYNKYSLSTWTANNSLFYDVPPGDEAGDWILGASSDREAALTISTDLSRGEGVLTLPRGVFAIQSLPVEEMQRNQYGAVQVDAQGDVAYQVRFGLGGRLDGVGSDESIPTAADLQVPNADKAVIAATLAQLSLEGKSDRDIVNQIAAYFQSFEYSLDLIRPDPSVTAVSNFLLNTQAGHCEYFASATALLLREAGIPARYAVGYSVHEFSPLEGQYIVRDRDAHAWTLYYLDGHWQVLDTTPPDWTAQEREMRTSFQSVSDFFAFLGFQFSYRMRQLGELGLREVLMIVIPLFCYLLWRSIQVFQGQQKNTAEALTSEQASQLQRNGLDSELYEIEAQLRSQDLQRLPAESFLQWCDRVKTALSESQWQLLREMLALHYRYRFDPNSLNESERRQLNVLSKRWQQEYSAKS